VGDRVLELDNINTLPDVGRIKARGLRMLDVEPGDRVLELGCGTGDDARALAEVVGAAGVVVGVDVDEALVIEARRRDVGPRPVDFAVGDIRSLSFVDASFDRCRSERLLQHLARPDDALDEMRRVLRPGGRIVLVDTDWGTSAINGADHRITRVVIEAWSDLHANGWAGRQLPSLLRRAGFDDVSAVADVVLAADAEAAGSAPLLPMAASAVKAGLLSYGEAADWVDQLHAASNTGSFLWATTVIAAGGRR
jgi:ubiquinone/menaquinone biosynthesis C-methylase UbiE